ncbi:1-acylglycerol-3-phosphate O-acyltransferase [Sorochytrium milnesiophthora]
MLTIAGLMLAVYLVLSLLARFGQLPRKPTYFIKASHLAILIPLASVFGLFTAVLLVRTKLRDSIPYYAGRTFAGLAKPVLGIRIDMRGLEHIRAEGDPSVKGGLNNQAFHGVFVANHQSSLDLVAMSAMFPKRCTSMAKHSLKYVPFLGLYMVAANTIFIDRANHAKALVTMASAAQRLVTERLSVFVYPEGTRSRTRERTMLPFKKGAFHLAVQAQVPIVPVVFSAYDDTYDSTRRRFDGGVVVIEFLPPIPTTGLTKDDVDQLTTTTRERMIEKYREISPPVKTD